MPTPTWKQRPPLSLSPTYSFFMSSVANIVYINSRGTIEDKDLNDLPPRLRKKRESILKDINEVLYMVKNGDFDGLCRLLRSNPYIQHWKLFEMALRTDSDHMYNATLQNTPNNSFTMKLVESGYEITERELNDMEKELLYVIDDEYIKSAASDEDSRRNFQTLKNWIIDHQLMRCKSLQELCRQSLRKQFEGASYIAFIEPLDYPQNLKDFLLKFP